MIASCKILCVRTSNILNKSPCLVHARMQSRSRFAGGRSFLQVHSFDRALIVAQCYDLQFTTRETRIRTLQWSRDYPSCKVSAANGQLVKDDAASFSCPRSF